jgi:hypothetical protein
LSPQARQEALARSIQVRQYRAGVRKELATGARTLRDVLNSAQAETTEGEMLARMKVRDVLESIPHIGPVRASAVMETVGVAPNRRLRGLGPRQIEELAERFEGR